MNKHSFAIALKKIFFSKGEPYLFNAKNLKFLPGTRPIRRKYISSNNDVVRNDILQIEYFEKNFTPQDILWDIGSHYGHYSIFTASIVNEPGQVFSFEPDKDAMAIQKKNIALNGLASKIKTFDLAVSNVTGTLQFNAMDGNANSHIVKVADATHLNVLTVASKTINDLLDELPEPTFVKMDTEGAEIDILRAASKLLQNPHIRFICELHPFAWEKFAVQYEEFETLLK